jgi:hypothetical protein
MNCYELINYAYVYFSLIVIVTPFHLTSKKILTKRVLIQLLVSAKSPFNGIWRILGTENASCINRVEQR